MSEHYSGKSCPICMATDYKDQAKRLHRKFWMRLLPGSQYYRCPKCRTEFVSLLGLVTVPIGGATFDPKYGKTRKPSYTLKVLVLLLTLLACIYVAYRAVVGEYEKNDAGRLHPSASSVALCSAESKDFGLLKQTPGSEEMPRS